MATWGSLVVPAMIAIGCGGSPKSAASSPSATAAASGTSDASDAGAAPAVVPAADAAATSTDPSSSAAAAASSSPTASSTASAPAAAAEHPFAHNAVEATSLIDDAITSRANELGQCVDAARDRRKSPHEKIVIEVGIDEEGHMLGVKLPKGQKPDRTLTDCVLAALRGAPFPKSHAGVITVRKTFEDKAVYR